jgi:2-polyprenyl-6-methoxyphenol hydroxylase-like FAD-dependent oxidoreductase
MTTKRRPKTRLEKDAHIAIIGSGLAGLGAALSLEQAGFTNISVFERDACPESRREGYGLTLTYNPNGPLAQMGLLEQVAQRDCPSRSHYLFSV